MAILDRLKLQATFWLGRRLPACEQLLPVMSQSLERRLTLRERVTLRLHFIICEFCVWYIEQLRLMRETVRARPSGLDEGEDSAAAPALSAEARERIKRALERESR